LLRTLLEVLTLIPGMLPLTETYLHLDSAFLPVHPQNGKSQSLSERFLSQARNLDPVEQQGAWALRVMSLMASLLVDLDSRIIQDDSLLLDLGVGPEQIDTSASQGLDLGTKQGDSSLKCLEDMVIPQGLPIGNDVSAPVVNREP
jgi:hypothetical protein